MPKYLDFEVTLKDARPKVWRRFLIQSNATFYDLHQAIQDACGWYDYHLFAFRTGRNTVAGIPTDVLFEDDEPDPDARLIKLSTFFKPGGARKCLYEYDFGDSWEHQVALKATVELPERFERRLTGGARAFPPEDCGGIRGYEECVRVAQGFRGETVVGDAEGLLEWMGDWDPEAFDLERAGKEFDR